MLIEKLKTSEVYFLKLDKCQIKVIKHLDGGISIFPKPKESYSTREFVFENSKPEVVEAIGKLLIEASKL